eukprot:7137809-Pyramimonas_sp.AAC.1
MPCSSFNTQPPPPTKPLLGGKFALLGGKSALLGGEFAATLGGFLRGSRSSRARQRGGRRGRGEGVEPPRVRPPRGRVSQLKLGKEAVGEVEEGVEGPLEALRERRKAQREH